MADQIELTELCRPTVTGMTASHDDICLVEVTGMTSIADVTLAAVMPEWFPDIVYLIGRVICTRFVLRLSLIKSTHIDTTSLCDISDKMC